MRASTTRIRDDFISIAGVEQQCSIISEARQHAISVPLYLAPKLALYLAMREGGMRNTELAKRLGISETVVRRMLDPQHNTKPERIQAALAELGKRIVISLEDSASPARTPGLLRR